MGTGQFLDDISLLQHLSGVRQDGAAHRRDFHRTAGAFEQRHPQFFLQFFDLPAQRRLTDKTAFRRLAKVVSLCHGNEIFQIPQIHERPNY